MNKICKTCDTKLRLCLCNGRNGDFKYCYRPVGSTSNITEKTIQPFNNINEVKTLLDNYIIDRNTIELCEYSSHMYLMMADIQDIDGCKHVPVGFVTY